MTIEQAIEVLEGTDFHLEKYEEARDFCEAYNMAVRSLEVWKDVKRKLQRSKPFINDALKAIDDAIEIVQSDEET